MKFSEYILSEVYKDSGLGKWFGKGGKGGKTKGGWDRYNTKGEKIGKCGDKKKGEGKPKCLSAEKAAKMTKKERANAVKRKRKSDPSTDRPGTGNKPINVSNRINEETKKVTAPEGFHWMEKGSNKYKLMKHAPKKFKAHKNGSLTAEFDVQKVHSESVIPSFHEFITEASKNVPTNPALWSKAKSAARSKFDVYPSAYANAWASKWYKKRGGGWKKKKS